MSDCLKRCLKDLLPWFIGASVISAIVAFFMGIKFTIGAMVIIAINPGMWAALAALVGVFILLFIVGITICINKCKGQ